MMEKNMARIIDYQVQNIVGNNIKKYRLEQGMSQKAHILSVSMK